MKKQGVESIIDFELSDDDIHNLNDEWFSFDSIQKQGLVYKIVNDITPNTLLTYPAGLIDENLGGRSGSLIVGDFLWQRASYEESKETNLDVRATPPFTTANEMLVVLLDEINHTNTYDSKKWYKIGWQENVEVGEEQKNLLASLFWDMDIAIVEVAKARYKENKKGAMSIGMHDFDSIGTHAELIDWSLTGLPAVILGYSQEYILSHPLLKSIAELQKYPILGQPQDQFKNGTFPNGYPIVFANTLHELNRVSQLITPVEITPEELMDSFLSNLDKPLDLKKYKEHLVLPVRDNNHYLHGNISALWLLHRMGYKIKAAMPESKVTGFNTCYRGNHIPMTTLKHYASLPTAKLPTKSAQ